MGPVWEMTTRKFYLTSNWEKKPGNCWNFLRIRNENPLKFENDLKLSTFRATVKS